jgi:hypothetical protein
MSEHDGTHYFDDGCPGGHHEDDEEPDTLLGVPGAPPSAEEDGGTFEVDDDAPQADGLA